MIYVWVFSGKVLVTEWLKIQSSIKTGSWTKDLLDVVNIMCGVHYEQANNNNLSETKTTKTLSSEQCKFGSKTNVPMS